MPLFDRSFKSNGVTSDYHEYLTDELVPHYVRENGVEALHGYLEGITDITLMVTEISQNATSLNDLKAALNEFCSFQLAFMERTGPKYPAV